MPTGDGVEITLHPGVTDGAADAVRHAARQLGVDVTAAATGRRIELPAGAATDTLLRRLVANPIIEHWTAGTAEPDLHPGSDDVPAVEVIAIRDLDDDALARARRRALAGARPRGAGRHPRPLHGRRARPDRRRAGDAGPDVERALRPQDVPRRHHDAGRRPSNLLGLLRDATDAVAAPFVRSAFVGNAGIVSFAAGTTIALKAETHNHPSAVEPFGGANTGVGGVIRDVLGAAHRPIACTDVLCFGPPDLPVDDLPDGALHPRRIREGVIDGVADYGNKIGLPTVAGAVLYDPAYTTNPLVFCGCIGVAADRPLPDGPFPGDRVVVLGGRTGRDGIRGATFSSATMDATTGEVAGASVQIGDPVTEKLLIDVLTGADDLWTAITDCGAGGLSSAVGEMAERIGADVELTAAPLKYPGLAPWEIWLSEAQERMVVAVPPATAGRAAGALRPPRRRARRPRLVHR